MEKNLQCIKKSLVLEVDFYFANLQSVGTWSKWKSKWTYKAIYTQIDLFWRNNHRKNYRNTKKLNNRPRKDLILKHQIICLIKKSCICNLNPAILNFVITIDIVTDYLYTNQ
jgi:hypothetical protein